MVFTGTVEKSFLVNSWKEWKSRFPTQPSLIPPWHSNGNTSVTSLQPAKYGSPGSPLDLCFCDYRWGYIFFLGFVAGVEQYWPNVFCTVIVLFPGHLARESRLLLGSILFASIGISGLPRELTITLSLMSWSPWLICLYSIPFRVCLNIMVYI